MSGKPELTEEEKEKLKLEREARKKAAAEEKAAKKAEKAAGRGGRAAAVEAEVPIVDYVTETAPEQVFGDYAIIQSRGRTGRVFVRVSDLNADLVGQQVWVRARIHNSRGKGNSAFLVLRQQSYTVQVAVFKSDAVTKEFLKYATSLSKETVVDLQGTVSAAEVKSCTQGNVELSAIRLYAVSKAAASLPLQIEDAARSEADIEASEKRAAETAGSENPERAFVRVNQDTRLDFRIIDLRVPAQQAIMRLSSAVSGLWRETLTAHGFTEIHTPKLIGGSSEGGSAVFQLKYFDQNASLAQSPQLYKQMAICADLGRVFEIGPVFRAESSNTHRHLCEFTGLDMEMEIFEHYFECLDMLDVVLSNVFHGLSSKHKADIELVSQQYPVTPFVCDEPGKNRKFTHLEAVNMLREMGFELEDKDDFTTEMEKRLGVYVKEKYNTDFYSVHRWPVDCRPFYTMKCHDDETYTNSYDIYMRGEEICSGAQRIHDSDMLKVSAAAKGMDPAAISYYIDAFKYGACPHGGGGVGLERVVMLYLGLPNVRKTSMFPRDPKRLIP